MLPKLEWKCLVLTSNNNSDHRLPTQPTNMRTEKQLQASLFDLEVPTTFPQKHLSVLQGKKRDNLPIR